MVKSTNTNQQPPEIPDRTYRALLTSANEIIQNGAGALIALLVTPYIAKELGFEQYGVWLMVIQVLGYVTWADLSPGSALKLSLITRQHEEDHEPKRRIISASLIVAFINLPIYFIGWLLLYWFMPVLLKNSMDWVPSARIAMTILMLGNFLTNFWSVFSNILRAMNFAYKAMGLRSLVLFGLSFAQVFVVGFGWGMPGLASLNIISNLTMAIILFFVARKTFLWLGLSKPRKQDVIGLLKFSPWLFLYSFGYSLFQSSDLLIIGWLLGPPAAASYGLTRTLPLLADRWLRPLVLSTNAGMGDLFGRREIVRLSEVRTELHMIILFLASIFGVIALAFNKSFIELWIGHEQFAGIITSAFVILGIILSLLSVNDMVLLDVCGYLSNRVILHTLCGLLVVSCGVLFSKYYGTAGMAGGILIGQVLLLLGIQMIIFRKLIIRDLYVKYIHEIIRPFILVGLIFYIAFLIGKEYIFSSWGSIILFASITGIITAGLMWYVGFKSKYRTAILIRVLSPIKAFRLRIK